MKRFGLADGLGLVGVLVALAWAPMLFDQLTPIKLLVLSSGGIFLAPAVIVRWKAMGRPSWMVAVPSAAVVLIVVWGVISALGSSAPLWGTLLGWWGRGDGWLAWLGAAFLFLGGATLTAREVARTITWLLIGATLVALVGVLQFAGVAIALGNGGPVVGLMGNTNFAAGYFAILAILALGRALTPGALWQRVWAAVLFVLLGFLAWQTGSLQGPAALGAGILALVLAYAMLYRGRFRTVGLVGAGVIVAFGIVLVVVSVFGVGPLSTLWFDGSLSGRQPHWQTAVAMMRGEPVFGAGPDGFARYVSEYRSESALGIRGPEWRISAAHNVALQFGAVLGYPGLILWIVAFLGTAGVLLVRIVRAPVRTIALTASVAGALTAYLVQGMVSIDMLPLLATGWLVAGLAIACAREPVPVTEPPPGKKRKTPASSEMPVATPVWVPISGGILALAAGLLVATQIGLTSTLNSDIDEEQAVAILTDSKTPCAIRVEFAGRALQELPPDVSIPAVLEATDLDRRCLTMTHVASEALIRQRIYPLAGTYTADAVQFDPRFSFSWILRGSYLLVSGDLAGAEAAAMEAQRLNQLYPEGGGPRLTAEVQALMEEIRLARERVS